MADIDLKTLTPDTSLPTTGFLFGADSQATASPSVYAVTTAITAILGNAASSDVLAFNSDTTFARKAIRNFRFGAADAATALAQTLSVQSVVAGTAGNVAGANFTINGSQGVGSGAGGSLIFQVAPAGSTATFTVTFTNGSATINGTGLPTTAGTAVAFTTTGALPTNFAINTTYFILAGSTATDITVAATAGGTAIVAGSAGSGTQTLTQALAQNALAAALTINSTGKATFVPTVNSTNSFEITNLAGQVIASVDSTSRRFNMGPPGAAGFSVSGATGGATIYNTGFLGWTSSGSSDGATVDARLYRDAAGVIGVRGTSTTVGAALSFIEQTAPASPAANIVRIYAEDNGSGKTRLMALFATGAAQQIAIEP